MARAYVIPKEDLKRMRRKLQQGESISIVEAVRLLNAFTSLRDVFQQQCRKAFASGQFYATTGRHHLEEFDIDSEDR